MKKQFFYRCIIEGDVHSMILFKQRFLEYRLSEILVVKNATGFKEKNKDKDNRLVFIRNIKYNNGRSLYDFNSVW